MYAVIQGTSLYIAVVTGMPPTGASAHGQIYYPGDIGLDLDVDNFFEFGIETTGITDGTHNDGNYAYDPSIQGNIYAVTDGAGHPGWNEGLNWGAATTVVELDLIDGTGNLSELGKTDLIFQQWLSTDHYIIELAIPLSLIGSLTNSISITQWSATCGNDVGTLTFDTNPITIPEPATVTLIGLTLLGLAVGKRKKL